MSVKLKHACTIHFYHRQTMTSFHKFRSKIILIDRATNRASFGLCVFIGESTSSFLTFLFLLTFVVILEGYRKRKLCPKLSVFWDFQLVIAATAVRNYLNQVWETSLVGWKKSCFVTIMQLINYRFTTDTEYLYWFCPVSGFSRKAFYYKTKNEY